MGTARVNFNFHSEKMFPDVMPLRHTVYRAIILTSFHPEDQ